MEFSEFAGYLEKLEGTGSRLEMTRILAELFEKAGTDDVAEITYLSQGMLGPKFDNPDFGMADKQVIKAIERVTEENVLQIFKREGDLGKTAEIVKVKSKSDKESTVGEVHKKLIEISGAAGLGSQEEKINKLSELLKELDPRSAKYVVKIVLGKMRAGFSDMTVLDSLSWMITGDKSLREDIERIYNVRADLGEVVKIIKSQILNPKFQIHPKSEILKIENSPIIGIPVLVARAERAKTVGEIWERNGESAGEHKLDGLRIQAHVNKHQIKLFSRGLEDVTSMYPDIVEGLGKQIDSVCILDGEMIAVDKNGRYLPFQETVQRKRKYGILEKMTEVPLKYFVFDLLFAEGENYLDKPNGERWERLMQIVSGKGDTVKLIPRKIMKSAGDIEEFFRESLADGTEGILVKKIDGVYKSGSRDFNWIKYKKSYDESGVADNLDLVVMGYDKGEGKRSGFGIGGFLAGVSDGDKYKTVAKIGTGLTDEEWRHLKVESGKLTVENKPENYEVSKVMECDVWVKPEIVVEIRSDEITKSPMHTSGFALRFPRLISFRDMKISDVTSASEVVKLFGLQRNERKNG
jgi:DNA ligase-1